MDKNMTVEANATQNTLLAYTAPELVVYSQAQITAGGANGGHVVDWIGGGTTSYKVS